MSPPRHASDDEMDAATWCRHLVPDGSVYAFLADHRYQLFPPELFADLARQRGGHPSVPAEVVARPQASLRCSETSDPGECPAVPGRLASASGIP